MKNSHQKSQGIFLDNLYWDHRLLGKRMAKIFDNSEIVHRLFLEKSIK